jgi:hypothetical protein
VGAGGGMILVELARNLPETNFYRSWLIILAPAVTLALKYAWCLLSPEIVLFVKSVRADIARKKLIRKIDALLRCPDISEAEKAGLRLQKERAKLSAIEMLQKRLDTTAA